VSPITDSARSISYSFCRYMPDRSTHVNPWIVTIAVMLATFMEVLDTTVVNVSIPHMAGNMGATYEEGTWVVTSYLVSNAIILPMAGWLASRFGQHVTEEDTLLEGVVGPALVVIEPRHVPAPSPQPEGDGTPDQPGPDDERPATRPALSRGGHRGALGRRGDRRGASRRGTLAW